MGNNVDCSYVLDISKKIYDLIEWIEPDLIPFFENIDNIQNKVNHIMSIWDIIAAVGVAHGFEVMAAPTTWFVDR